MAENKLTKEQKREVVAHLVNGTMDASDIQREYNLSDRQIRYYKNLTGTNVPAGRPTKTETIQEEAPTKAEEIVQEVQQEVETTPSEVVEDKPLREEDLDPDKLWCATCFSNGVKTEIFAGQYACPTCGASLKWH